MRLPLAPSKSPATDLTAKDSVFHIVQLLRVGKSPTFQKTASEVAYERDWKDASLLIENMVGAFAQRCDQLMDDMSSALEAPGLFSAVWPITTYSAGVRNEQWLRWWSAMRQGRKR